MAVRITRGRIENPLTRTSGYLAGVTSHSLQPYRGCTFGRSLCGVSCYVQHNRFVTRGESWGRFLEVRENAADAYRQHVERERAWARARHGAFSVFLSSATDPFLAQESKFGVTRAVLAAMRDAPPDVLVVQTHTHRVLEALEPLCALAPLTELRVHLSIESDRDRLPGLPAPASSVERRFDAAQRLRSAGLRVVITVSPLLPIEDPGAFFARIAGVADACVVDHFIGGDGSREGARTRRTALPDAMRAVDARTLELAYRDEIIAIARQVMPGRVGVSAEGFAGRYR